MYFKQLSLDTLNESNQWSMLNEGDIPNMVSPEIRNVALDMVDNPNNYTEDDFWNNPIIRSLQSAGLQLRSIGSNLKTAIKNAISGWDPRNTPENIDLTKIAAEEGAKSSITGDEAIGQVKLSNLNDTYSKFKEGFGSGFWDSLAKWFGQAYDDKDDFINKYFPRIGQYLRDNPYFAQKAAIGVGGTATGGGLWAALKSYFGGEKETPQEIINQSNLGTYTMYGAAAAGILGTIWLIKRWLKNRTFDKQSVEYAAKLNQMKPEDIPEEDKDKPIEA